MFDERHAESEKYQLHKVYILTGIPPVKLPNINRETFINKVI